MKIFSKFIDILYIIVWQSATEISVFCDTEESRKFDSSIEFYQSHASQVIYIVNDYFIIFCLFEFKYQMLIKNYVLIL